MCSFLCVVASKIEGDVHCSGYADSEHWELDHCLGPWTTSDY
jgi:hypothetical protein